MRVIGLFSGIGGMLEGFKAAKHECLFALEPEKHAFKVLKDNFPWTKTTDDCWMHTNGIPFCDVMCVGPGGDISHVARIASVLMPRVVASEVNDGRFSHDLKDYLDKMEYRSFTETLNARDFGLPQDRGREFMVSFRKDYKVPFISFPFPEPRGMVTTMSSIMDHEPDPSLTVSAETLESIARRDEARASRGYGHRTKIVPPDGVCPALTPTYARDRRFLLNSETGPRRPSAEECKAIMGFPREFKLDVPLNRAYSLLGAATCPPVAQALAEELDTWISR